MVSTALGLMGAKPGPLDASLRDSRNVTTSLSHYRGKPTILFYEDRATAHENDPFKHALIARGRTHNVSTAANVVAVADLQRYDFFPVRGFALQAVRDVEKRNRIPVLVDWNGVLTAPPWNLPRGTSSVVVLDPQGNAVYVHSGKLAQPDIEAAFASLTRLLNVDLSQGAETR